MDVTLKDFEWQLEWLSENREIVDLESALRRWDSPESDQLVVLTFDDGYSDTYATVFPILKTYGLPFTVYIATSHVSDEDDFRESLTWAQLNEMAESGLATLATHTHSHADLRGLDESEVIEEIDKSTSLLESRLGVRPQHFAYPWGYWSETADPIIRTEYSSAALGTPHIGTASRDFDPYLMHRFPVQLSDGQRWFEARLIGGVLLEEEVRRRLRGYRGP